MLYYRLRVLVTIIVINTSVAHIIRRINYIIVLIVQRVIYLCRSYHNIIYTLGTYIIITYIIIVIIITILTRYYIYIYMYKRVYLITYTALYDHLFRVKERGIP